MDSGGSCAGDFLFWAGGFSGGFLSADFSFAFCDQKTTAKIHHFHGGLLEDFPPEAETQTGHEQIPSSELEPSLKLESGLSAPFFWPRLRNSWSMATAPLEIPRQASLKPHRLIEQEIAHSKARRQAETYISKKDGTTKFIASSEGRQLEQKNPPKLISAEMAAKHIAAISVANVPVASQTTAGMHLSLTNLKKNRNH